MVAKKTASAAKKTASKVPHQDVFDRIVSGYPQEFTSCRDFGHSWGPLTAKQGRNGVIERTLSCANCGARRNQTLDKFGYVLTNNYGYSDGYVMPGVGRLTAAQRATLRLANLTSISSGS